VTTIDGASRTDNRCSTWARTQGLDPIGTIGTYAGYILVEWPLPWPRDAAAVPELADVAALARQHRLRLQLITPVSGAAEDRVVLYRRNATGVTGFTRSSRRVEGYDTVKEVVEDLVAAGPSDADAERDLLICGHGSRDRCCGSLGTGLALAAARDLALDGLRLWRTSHTGGHRFAPTAILLPEGTSWAFLDVDSLARVVHRRGPIGDVLASYRGCSALPSPAVQVLEREALAEMGWVVFDSERTGADGADGRAHVEVRTPHGEVRQWEGTVTVARRVPMPACGQGPSPTDKEESEYSVELA
jgi:hypothetical protein